MKKINKKKGFSFIELMIVVSILAILSVAGIMSFGDKIDSLKANSVLSEISGNIFDLDNKVNNKQIFDYEIFLEKDKNYYLINENIFDTDYKLELNSTNNGIGNFKISNGSSSGTGSVKFYSGYKFQKEDIKAGNETFTGKILENKNYKIMGSYSGNILNNLEINNYGNNLKLVKIDTNNSPLNSIKIKNILGKKQFGNSNSINKLVLTFEDELGKDYILEINK